MRAEPQRFSLSVDAILQRAWETLSVNWMLGFTAFGGPPVHFKIVRHNTAFPPKHTYLPTYLTIFHEWMSE